MELEKLAYPIGRFEMPQHITPQMREAYIRTLAETPQKVMERSMVLTGKQINTPYRPNGWTPRQVIHHLADSHMHAYMRTHWALTEDTPTIKTYDEKAWAELPDSQNAALKISVDLLTHLHKRWVFLLENIKENDFQRAYYHPQSQKTFTIEQMLALYDWHSRHHLAHLFLV